ncbi:MAG TPA: hypothetical protein VFV38_10475 [Ktedonobacteraceae bacterium]|nr:hypothetical protein [Ktedonobacteraceae bacterium]
MLTPYDEIIRYDGRTLAVTIRPPVQIEARRGRRWRWFGQKGWWIHLHLLQGWHIRKFVLTLSEAGVFLKYDPDYLPWIEKERQRPASGHQPPSEPPAWSGMTFLLF